MYVNMFVDSLHVKCKNNMKTRHLKWSHFVVGMKFARCLLRLLAQNFSQISVNFPGLCVSVVVYLSNRSGKSNLEF